MNTRAGKQRTDPAFLSGLFREAGFDHEVRAAAPPGISGALNRILEKEFGAVAVAGGDGTLSAAAEKLLGREIPLAVLPAGTRNHFASDANIPADLRAAVRLIASTEPRRIDVGELNGRIFLNNSSVGLYPRAVRIRDRFLHQLGGRKGIAMLIGMLTMFRRFPLLYVDLRTGEGSQPLITPFVFIGNNRYHLDLFRLGSRNTFTGGGLSVYAANCRSRSAILRLVAKTVFNRLHQDRDFTSQYVPRVEIRTPRPAVSVALDGALRHDLAALEPDVVVVSGDLTQRARSKQFAVARDYLRRLPHPQVVVPGNHDIPLFDLFRRFLLPLARYKKFISPLVDTVFRDDEIVIMGINTARSLTWKEGRISVEQMAAMREVFCPIGNGVLKILVTHHPFIPPPQDSGVKLVGRSKLALKVIAACEVELLLAGHLHHGYSGDVRTHDPAHRTSVLVVQAGTAVSRRTRETPNAFNVLEVRRGEIRLLVRRWDGRAFALERDELFRKADGEWLRGA